jgi:hypothetical protein
MAASTARSFLGMLCRQYSEADVAAAIQVAAGKSDPKAYIVSVLQNKPKRGEKPVRKVAL